MFAWVDMFVIFFFMFDFFFWLRDFVSFISYRKHERIHYQMRHCPVCCIPTWWSYTQHSFLIPCNIPDPTFPIPRSSFFVLHSSFLIPHSLFVQHPHLTLLIPRSSFPTEHSWFNISHSMLVIPFLYWSFWNDDRFDHPLFGPELKQTQYNHNTTTLQYNHHTNTNTIQYKRQVTQS